MITRSFQFLKVIIIRKLFLFSQFQYICFEGSFLGFKNIYSVNNFEVFKCSSTFLWFAWQLYCQKVFEHDNNRLCTDPVFTISTLAFPPTSRGIPDLYKDCITHVDEVDCRCGRKREERVLIPERNTWGTGCPGGIDSEGGGLAKRTPSFASPHWSFGTLKVYQCCSPLYLHLKSTDLISKGC